MVYVKWGFFFLLAAVFVAFLHYTLPRHQVVRVVDVYEKLETFGNNKLFWAQPDSGAAAVESRDVRFIDTIRVKGKQLVFRNEDTNWGWPPYFKFNASDLSARAKDLVSTKEEPQWVLMRYYGWRSNWMSIYPNATSLKAVPSPDYTVIPWFNIAFFIVFAWLGYRIWRWWDTLYDDRIEPFFDDIRYRFKRSGK